MIIPLEWMPPLMFGGLVVFMIIGYPVAFSLAAVGFFFGFLSIDFGYLTMPFMQAIPSRVFGNILANELLLAIPFFTFMGAILEKCGLAGTCWNRWASCSARSAAASAIRRSSW